MSHTHEQLWAVDLDRTLLDTDAAFDWFVHICDEAGVADWDMLQYARAEVQESGGSFDVLGCLSDRGVDEAEMHELYEAFIVSASPDDILYDDAMPFLDELQRKKFPAMILTYGARSWQSAKLQAAGLSGLPYVITSRKRKGRLIEGWRVGDGYAVRADNGQQLKAETVTLVDDKAEAFQGLPEDCPGYWLQRSEQLLASQVGTVSPQVLTVRGLSQIVHDWQSISE